MSRIRGKDTKPELIVRSAAHRLGYRFRLHVKTLPGKPDLVFRSRNVALFVHGCFWHRHAGCPYCYDPKSNIEFWNQKFKKNVAHDQSVRVGPKERGWPVPIICASKTANSDRLPKTSKHF